MPKNIIICCDGTDNKMTLDRNTNVIHLYSFLEKSDNQVAYYSPGVGTIAPDNIKNAILRWFSMVWDLATAYSLEANVMDAYKYLMNTYEDGDKIYLFGFSRGAYTVRMLSGLIEMFGLLDKGNENHLRHLLKVYSQKDEKFHLGSKIRGLFTREIKIHFIGVWDTVVAIGNPFSFYNSYPYSSRLSIANTVRHAVSIDERRKHYRLTHLQNRNNPDHHEVYFAGVHSDVGGSYPENESGLSRISLKWMLGEASQYDLLLNKIKISEFFASYNHNEDIKQKPHNSLTLGFILFDFVPRIRYNKSSRFGIKIDFRLWPKRQIRETAKIHESVLAKIQYHTAEHNYAPKNVKLANNEYVWAQTRPIK